MQRPNLETVPPFYKNYVLNVKDYEMMHALKVSNEQALHVVRSISEANGEHRYQSGKWSIKELICHLLDAVRLCLYRALRFARNDKTEVHGFEENDSAPEANAHARSIAQLADEMQRLRNTTIDLFSSFTPTMLQRAGKANRTELSVLNLGYIVAGHETHHRLILEQRHLAQ